MKIISEWKIVKVRENQNYPRSGYKRVEAIVKENGRLVTRHIDIEK